MLWLGGALASKAADITEPASQLDLAATLVGQLGAGRFSISMMDLDW